MNIADVGLSLAAIVLLGPFLKLVTTLNILRIGLGLQGAGFGLVTSAAALALTLGILEPELKSVGGVRGLFVTNELAQPAKIVEALEPYSRKNADPNVEQRLRTLRGDVETVPNDIGMLFSVSVLTQLRDALKAGCLILVPFLIVDLLVVHILALLGAAAVSPALVAVPLKLLLFTIVDGWRLIGEKLFAMGV